MELYTYKQGKFTEKWRRKAKGANIKFDYASQLPITVIKFRSIGIFDWLFICIILNN